VNQGSRSGRFTVDCGLTQEQHTEVIDTLMYTACPHCSGVFEKSDLTGTMGITMSSCVTAGLHTHQEMIP
jgi:hypothetical protein